MKNFLAPVMENKVVNKVTTEVTKFYVNHESAILTGGTIGFSLATTAITLRNAGEINAVIFDAKSALACCNSDDEKKQIYALTLKKLAPLVAPIIIFQSATIGCAVMAKKQSDKKVAELASALTIAQQAVAYYQNFQKDTQEALGEKKYQKLQKDIADNTVYEASGSPVNSKVSEDDQLIYEPVTGQIFWSTPDRINTAWVIYKNNVRNSGNCFVSLADGRFLEKAGADDTCMAADLFGHYNEDAEKMDDSLYLNATKVRVNGKEMAALAINYYPVVNFFGEITN